MIRKIQTLFWLLLLFSSALLAQETPPLWPQFDWEKQMHLDTLMVRDENGTLRMKAFRNTQSGDSIFLVFNRMGRMSHRFEGKQRDPLQGTSWWFSKNNVVLEKCQWLNDQPHGDFLARFPNGKEKMRGRFEEGMKEGLWKTRHPDGSLQSSGVFVQEVRDGRWSFFHPDSVPAYYEQWQDGEIKTISDFQLPYGHILPGGSAQNGRGQVQRYHLSGHRKQRFLIENGLPEGDFWEYDSLGRPLRKKTFLEGELEGWLIEFYPDSSLASKTQFRKGVEQGQTLSYYPNGQLAVSGWFQAGKEDSTWVEWSESGKKLAQYRFAKGKMTGEYLEYFDHQQLKKRAWFTNGVPDSLTEEWNEKGVKKSEIWYKNGQKNGRNRQWYDNGRMQSDGHFQNDLEEGPWKSWFDNGRKQSEGQFHGGKAAGPWKTWFGNGKPATEGQYLNGQEEGTWRFYYPSGTLKNEEIWNTGKLMEVKTSLDPKGKKLPSGNLSQGSGTLKTYNLEGKPEGSGPMKNGLQEGEWTYFWPNGKIQARGGMKSGKRHGKWTYFFMGGEKAEESEYHFDEPVGTMKRYDPDGSLQEEVDMNGG